MTTSESKGRFFLQNESIRIDSHNESNRIDSNRELECSISYCDLGKRISAAYGAKVNQFLLLCRCLIFCGTTDF